jgi:hypothetical protein
LSTLLHVAIATAIVLYQATAGYSQEVQSVKAPSAARAEAVADSIRASYRSATALEITRNRQPIQ